MIRKDRKHPVLTEEWHDTEDGGRLLLLKYPFFAESGLVKHGISTRFGGVSEGIFSTMNLSFARGDDPDAVRENFRRIAKALGTAYENFVFTDQTHTTNVRKATSADAGKGLTRERDYRDVDGLITDEPGLVLSTFYADCVPLFFVDPVRRAIGLSHSGWRGTVGRMGAVTIAAMEREYGSRPEDLLCAVGPSICQDCYEVGEDVAAQFEKAFAGTAQAFGDAKESGILRPGAPGKYQLDLWRANECVLLEAGVLPEHIAVTDVCTCCNPDVLFSHRASQGRRGNFGAFLCLSDETDAAG